MSLFSAVEMAPRDPILGLNEQFAADTNPNKVNLGVGVYFDENGKLPLLQCVQTAEKALMEAPKPRGYLPIDGIAAYDTAVKKLVFGAESEVFKSGRIATVQGLGGTGGLKIGADFLKKLLPSAKVLISDPSWENHRALFTQAGFEVNTYRYYNSTTRALDFDGMKYVTDRSYVPVLADESVFSPADALKIMQMRAADLVNIKLMKCGGIYNALKIASAAECYGVECMIGCMLEAKISVNAAVHLACAKKVITKVDLDGPVLCIEDHILGGAVFNEKVITVSDEPGMGIQGVKPGKIKYLD